MRNFTSGVSVSRHFDQFVLLSQNCFSKVDCNNMASLFLVKEGECYFSINDDAPQRIKAGELFCTTQGTDVKLSTAGNYAGLVEKPLASIPLGNFETHEIDDGHAALIFHSLIPGTANPLPGVVPLSLFLTVDEIRSIPELSSFLSFLQNNKLLQPSITEWVHNKISEIVATAINEFALERMESDMHLDKAGLINLRIAKVLKEVHRSPEHRWNLVNMAETAHLSRSAFAKEFKALTGSSPIKYLSELRMERAAYALSQGEKSISQIADEAGYESDAAFNKAFRKLIGNTPGQYRRMVLPRNEESPEENGRLN